jgi:hypothetical protein
MCYRRKQHERPIGHDPSPKTGGPGALSRFRKSSKQRNATTTKIETHDDSLLLARQVMASPRRSVARHLPANEPALNYPLRISSGANSLGADILYQCRDALPAPASSSTVASPAAASWP